MDGAHPAQHEAAPAPAKFAETLQCFTDLAPSDTGASVAHQADKIADKSTIMRDQEGSEGLQTETGTEVGVQAKGSGEMQQEADKKDTGGDEEMENLEEEAPGSQKDAWPEKGSAVEVLSEGEWWDAHVIELDADASRVKVHYVGGVEDEDEWVDVCDRVRKPVTQVLTGSVRNPYCKKFRILHFLDRAIHWVQELTDKTIPKRCSDKALDNAIRLAKQVLETGKIPPEVQPASGDVSFTAGGEGLMSEARGGRGAGRGKPTRKMLPQTPQQRRRAAMRKLGLLPPENFEYA